MYDSLISQINAYIRTNANNEITGQGLNGILNIIINSIGAGMTFYGFAEPSTVPIQDERPKFYIAFSPGKYTNFNLASLNSFSSGFAVIYDAQGTNDWIMLVKSGDVSNSAFLIDAAIQKSSYPAGTLFYVKTAKKTTSNNTFSVYATDSEGSFDRLVVTFTTRELKDGYYVHKVDAGENFTALIGLNWSEVPLNEDVTFSYEQSKFPNIAYARADDSEAIAAVDTRLGALELYNKLKVDSVNKSVTRRNELYDYTYLGTDPVFTYELTLDQYKNSPQLLSSIMQLYYPTIQVDTAMRLNLYPNNFPASGLYTIVTTNSSNTYRLTITVMNYDASSRLRSQDTYELQPMQSLVLTVLKPGNLNFITFKGDILK